MSRITKWQRARQIMQEATLPDMGCVEYIVYAPWRETEVARASFWKWRGRIAVTVFQNGTMRCDKVMSSEGGFAGTITKADREGMKALILARLPHVLQLNTL